MSSPPPKPSPGPAGPAPPSSHPGRPGITTIGEGAPLELKLYLRRADNGEEDEDKWCMILYSRGIVWAQVIDLMLSSGRDADPSRALPPLSRAWMPPISKAKTPPKLSVRDEFDWLLNWYQHYTKHEGIAAMGEHMSMDPKARPMDEQYLLRIIKHCMHELWVKSKKPKLPADMHETIKQWGAE